jgi:V/A-type H+-transporting ATPase subunit I
MAVSEMRKVRVFAHNSSREKIIEELQNLGIVQIIEVEEEKKPELNLEKLQARLEKIKYSIEYLSGFEPRKKGFLSSFLEAKPLLSEKEFLKISKEFNYEKVYKECLSLDEQRHQLNNRENKLITEQEKVLPWQNLTLPLEEIKETDFTETLLGIISSSDKEELREELKAEELHLEVIEETVEKTYLFLTYLKEKSEEVNNSLKKYNFEEVSFKGRLGQPKKILSGIKKELEEIRKEKEELRVKSERMLKDKIKLMALYDHFFEFKEREQVKGNLGRTLQTFSLRGWVKKRDAEKLRKRLNKISQEIEILESIPEEGEEVPVDLENRGLVKPFEVVTNLYGLPHLREIDPSPLLAPFFAFFFALCLTDAGYGAVLALLSYFLLKKLSLGPGGKKLLQLLFLVGVATVIVGIFTGGAFGITISKRLVIFNPLEDILPFFLFCLIIGLIQISFGFGVKLYANIKEGKALDALFDQASWLMIIGGLIIFGLAKKEILSQAYLLIAEAIILIGGLLILLFYGREHKNIFSRLSWGMIFGLFFGTIGIVGDILSYIRLFALGLATSVLALVINKIAMIGLDMVPYVGFLVMLLILVGGHFFNLAINTLGGFAHTTRLQFVEFFTKLNYEGGGEAFKPFRRETEYTIVR